MQNALLTKFISKNKREKEFPEFRPGDTIKVHVKIKEGEKERLQAFEGLEALFLAFLDLDVNLDRVAGAKLGEFLLPLVLGNKLGQQRILHDNVRNLLVYNMFRVRGERESCLIQDEPGGGTVSHTR